MRLGLFVALAISVASAIACAGGSRGPSNPAIHLTTGADGSAYVEVSGLSAPVLRALDAHRPGDDWTRILRVAVADAAPPMLGTVSVANSALRFTPQFRLDPGREYRVRFNGAAVAGWDGGGAAVVEATVRLPAVATEPSTVVSHVYPSGDVVPANMLRMYVEFSAPMGRKSGVEYLHLLDHEGHEIRGAVLPLDYEFWSPDHRRFTVFFDPGRVKQGILPNQQMGRPLEAGHTVTLVVDAAWRDANGLPLKEGFRRQFQVRAAVERPLNEKSWKVEPAAGGSRGPLVVTFPEPLDRGLLMRALSVTRDGRTLEGEIAIDKGETRWTFTPTEAWRQGPHVLQALDILEDLAGNQIGRAFEVDNFDTVDKDPDAKTVAIPFAVR